MTKNHNFPSERVNRFDHCVAGKNPKLHLSARVKNAILVFDDTSSFHSFKGPRPKKIPPSSVPLLVCLLCFGRPEVHLVMCLLSFIRENVFMGNTLMQLALKSPKLNDIFSATVIVMLLVRQHRTMC